MPASAPLLLPALPTAPRASGWRWLAGVLAVAAVVLAAEGRVPADSAPSPTLRVGLDAAALPLHNGLRDYTGDGVEALLATALAQQLGRAVELVPLAPQAHLPALQQGQVDVVLQHQAPGAPPLANVRAWPTGYHSGLSVALRSDTDVRRWQDLAGRVVCRTAANGRARWPGQAVQARDRAFDAPAQVLAAVRTGDCAAAVFDQALLGPLRQRAEWAKFAATLPPVAPRHLVAAVRTDRPALAAAVRRALAEVATPAQWAQWRARWAASVAFEVYFDQVGPDCH